MSMADEIAKLNELKQNGAISEQEYQKAKDTLLARNQPAGEKFKQAIDGISSDVNTWGMLIHLSQLCAYLLPFAGLIVPIILWQVKKNESPIIDQHGKIVVNWIITALILGAVSGLLCFVFIGFFLILALGVMSIIFPIIGGLKAQKGEIWPYPLSITFFK